MSGGQAIPLEGINLIEASAGSGKTYSITELFVRLLLEKDLSVENILVVTYTVAATNELKARIRNAISKEIGKHKPKSKERRILRKALLELDEASISTIHSFCQKVLTERAFESGSIFGAGLDPEEKPLLQASVDDYFRQVIIGSEIEKQRIMRCGKKKFDYENAVSFVSRELFNPVTSVLPRESPPVDFAGILKIENEVLRAFEELKRFCNNNPDSMGEKSADIMDFLHNRSVVSICAVIDGLKTGRKKPDESFKEKLDMLKARVGEYKEKSDIFCRGLRLGLIGFIPPRLEAQKKLLNVLSYDDLIQNTWQALFGLKAGDAGAGTASQGSVGLSRPDAARALVETVRERYRAVLIDEFQDTDPLQYGIFKKLFFDDSKGAGVFLIGDPKQSIYAFRGADIFSYNNARNDADCSHSLSFNWRSEAGLISAVNKVFSLKKNPFIYDWIPFTPAHHPGGRKPRQEELQTGQPGSRPLEIIFVDTELVPEDAQYKGKLKNEEAKKIIAQSVGEEISLLLSLSGQGKARIGDSPVKRSDFAILVGENRDADFMKEELSRFGIPSVVYSRRSVFETEECRELASVLKAVANPSGESLLKEALLTSLIGLTYDEVHQMVEDGKKIEQVMDRFYQYHQIWADRSFIEMAAVLVEKEEIRPRILSRRNSERRLTNLTHLIELVQREAHNLRLSMSGTIKWLEEMRDARSSAVEDNLLRLESDENAVKIVTIHRSKGLEFPIVFIPFFFKKASVHDEHYVKFHGPDNRLCIDIGSDEFDENKRTAQKEALAEQMRLLYVAMTRARHKCYYYWGNIYRQESSAPRFLFHFRGDAGSGQFIEDLSAFDDYARMKADMEELAEDPHIGLSYIPRQDGQARQPGQSSPGKEESLSLLVFPPDRLIDNGVRIGSFSGMAFESKRFEPSAESDIGEVETGEEHQPAESVADGGDTIFTFPRGTTPGLLFHEIMEKLDFGKAGEEDLIPLVESSLESYGFEKRWVDPLCRAIGHVINTPLGSGGQELRLSGILSKDRLNEVAFYYPVKKLSAGQMERILSARPGGAPPVPAGRRLHFNPFRGFMSGVIDLVFRFNGRFYLLDWKTNYLGPRAEDYGREKLPAAMAAHLYDLQYHLYVLALDQYLRLKVRGYRYQENFGGVFYLFVRGLGSGMGSEYGVFHDRIPAGALEEMRREILDLSRAQLGQRSGYDSGSEAV
jgi:exodeoxyribonuclease V beta subunit